MFILVEEDIKELVKRTTIDIGVLVGKTDNKVEGVKFFLSELYQVLNRIYNLDGLQEKEEEYIIPFFWEIDKNWDVQRSRFIR